jgi:hypothetical protein
MEDVDEGGKNDNCEAGILRIVDVLLVSFEATGCVVSERDTDVELASVIPNNSSCLEVLSRGMYRTLRRWIESELQS